MKPGGSLQRYTPLAAGKPLERKTPLKPGKPMQRTVASGVSPTSRSKLHAESVERRQQQRRPRSPQVPAKVRKGLALRSDGRCEVAQPGCTWTATDFSHRLKVGAGGRHGAAAVAHHVLSNALAACRTCHSQRLHANPADAYAAGWMLREGQTPARHRVLYRGAWVWLTDTGLVLTSPPNT